MQITIAGHYTWIQPATTQRKRLPLHPVSTPVQWHSFYVKHDVNRMGVHACL
jgi:hypothetical protein